MGSEAETASFICESTPAVLTTTNGCSARGVAARALHAAWSLPGEAKNAAPSMPKRAKIFANGQTASVAASFSTVAGSFAAKGATKAIATASFA